MAVPSFSAQLKTARERKGLSQRALGERVGLPQSHISRIEAGAVDPQASSLMQIARALDLELVLLPRGALAAVRALTSDAPAKKPAPAYRLDASDYDDA